jgi:hypothetical protein
MTAFNFPNSPAVDDTYTHNGVTYRWTGVRWTNVDPGDVVFSGNVQTVSNKKLMNYSDEVYEIIDGASVELDPSNGHVQLWTLGASRTPDQANWASGQSITLLIDDGASYAITWTTLDVQWKTNGGTAPTLSETLATVIVLWKVGVTIYGARIGDA